MQHTNARCHFSGAGPFLAREAFEDAILMKALVALKVRQGECK